MIDTDTTRCQATTPKADPNAKRNTATIQDDSQITQLSPPDSEYLLMLLENPPPPTQALRDAIAQYHKA